MTFYIAADIGAQASSCSCENLHVLYMFFAGDGIIILVSIAGTECYNDRIAPEAIGFDAWVTSQVSVTLHASEYTNNYTVRTSCTYYSRKDLDCWRTQRNRQVFSYRKNQVCTPVLYRYGCCINFSSANKPSVSPVRSVFLSFCRISKAFYPIAYIPDDARITGNRCN